MADSENALIVFFKLNSKTCCECEYFVILNSKESEISSILKAVPTTYFGIESRRGFLVKMVCNHWQW